MRGWRIGIGLLLAATASPVLARSKAPPPAPPAPVVPQVHSGDSSVDFHYYQDRKGAPLWLGSDGGRQAAARLVEALRRAPIDGLADGPVLAAAVEQALGGTSLEDDAKISVAYVKLARVMRAPVANVEYGDPSRALAAPGAAQALTALAAAPSMAAAVDALANANPLYSSLRAAALAEGRGDDPHVRGTLARLRQIPAKGRLILVDTASQRLMMVEDGQVTGTMKVIVGKQHSPTFNIASTIHYVTLNPYWNIPLDVVRKRVAPIVLKRGTSYLKAARYVTTERWGVGAAAVDPDSIDWKAVAAGEKTAYLRQLPGPNNMMGKMKFGFVNSADIFLHDTPKKKLFDKPARDLSMGCVRLEHAGDLAKWLLGSEPVLGDDAPEQQVQVAGGIPVYTAALTAFVGGDGKIAYADDLYGYDDPSRAALIAASSAAPATDDGK